MPSRGPRPSRSRSTPTTRLLRERTAPVSPDRPPRAGVRHAGLPEPDRVAARRAAAAPAAVGPRQAGTVALVDETLADLGLGRRPGRGVSVVAGGEARSRPGRPPAVRGGARPGAGDHRGLPEQERVGRPASRLAAGRPRRSPVARSRAGQLSGPVLEQLAACYLLDAVEVILRYAARASPARDVLLSALAEHLPDWRSRAPSGGLVPWCELASSPLPRWSAPPRSAGPARCWPALRARPRLRRPAAAALHPAGRGARAAASPCSRRRPPTCRDAARRRWSTAWWSRAWRPPGARARSCRDAPAGLTR